MKMMAEVVRVSTSHNYLEFYAQVREHPFSDGNSSRIRNIYRWNETKVIILCFRRQQLIAGGALWQLFVELRVVPH